MATRDQYKQGRVLMIGDADGDRKAAEAVDALFYPINPGQEDASWRRFHDQAYDKFLEGTFAGQYQAEVNDEFETLLPAVPPWKRDGE